MSAETEKESLGKKTVYKRPLDIITASLGIVTLSPIFMLTAVAIKMEDKGPVIFRQKRLTQNGKVFEIYKFRSMRINAEDVGVGLMRETDDDRVTCVGEILRKSHLDELPQLWNVLRGDMSIVGPRPELPELTELYCKDIPDFGKRLQIKAGLTGYAQVYCENNDDPSQKIKFDLEYIDKMSLLTDLKIILATFQIKRKRRTENRYREKCFDGEGHDRWRRR